LRNTEQINELISAAIPDRTKYLKLYEKVEENMIHGTCVKQNINSLCMSNENYCTKNFLRKFFDEITFNNDGYPS